MLNSPKYSKINWTAAATLVASLAVAFGGVSPEHEVLIYQGLTVVSPFLIMVWRTWFTGNNGD
jgi:fucose 4-O-acetylase-like acetyltransferase